MSTTPVRRQSPQGLPTGQQGVVSASLFPRLLVTNTDVKTAR